MPPAKKGAQSRRDNLKRARGPQHVGNATDAPSGQPSPGAADAAPSPTPSPSSPSSGDNPTDTSEIDSDVETVEPSPRSPGALLWYDAVEYGVSTVRDPRFTPLHLFIRSGPPFLTFASPLLKGNGERGDRPRLLQMPLLVKGVCMLQSTEAETEPAEPAVRLRPGYVR